MSCISIDWLQLSTVSFVNTCFDADFSPNKVFKVQKKDIRHNVFKDHVEIFSNSTGEWEPCAVYSYNPLSYILPAGCGHLKIINKYLYQSDLERLVVMLLREFKLKFKSVSRMDVSLDLRKFHRLSVPGFIRGFILKKYLKLKSTSFHLDGKATRTMPVHYLRFGAKSSGFEFYIYNKSKELREVKDKPYIRDKWNKCKLSGDKDVWRIEFCIHPSVYGLVHSGTGEIISFNDFTVCKDEFVHDLFYTLFFQHFVFVLNDGQKKKERMKRLVLLKSKPYTFLYLRVSEKTVSNRMDKVFIKMLERLNRDWRLHNKDPVTSEDILKNFIDNKDLQKWYDEFMILNLSNDKKL